jgi:hypothetical protein
MVLALALLSVGYATVSARLDHWPDELVPIRHTWTPLDDKAVVPRKSEGALESAPFAGKRLFRAQRGREDSNPRLLVLETSSYPLYKAESCSVATPLATPSNGAQLQRARGASRETQAPLDEPVEHEIINIRGQ